MNNLTKFASKRNSHPKRETSFFTFVDYWRKSLRKGIKLWKFSKNLSNRELLKKPCTYVKIEFGKNMNKLYENK